MLAKKRPKNAFLTLIGNYHKIGLKKKITTTTTTNWLFNDI